jgi:hypothetical protein
VHRVAARAVLTIALLVACNTDGPQPSSSPGTPSPFVARLLSDSTLGWSTESRDALRAHAIRDSYAARQLGALTDSAVAARDEVLKRLDERAQASDGDVHLFFLRGREDFTVLVGQPAGGWTEPEENAILVAAGESAPPALRHEFGHLYSHRRWGPPAAVWLSEGVAVFAVGHCAGRSLHDWAAAAASQGEPMSLAALQQFDFTRAAPHLVAGSFVQHVAETHGIGAVRTLWQEGLAGAQSATGVSTEALEASWLDRIRNLPGAEARQHMNVKGRVRCDT